MKKIILALLIVSFAAPSSVLAGGIDPVVNKDIDPVVNSSKEVNPLVNASKAIDPVVHASKSGAIALPQYLDN